MKINITPGLWARRNELWSMLTPTPILPEKYHTVYKDGVEIAYVLTEFVRDYIAMPHISIPKKHRTKENLAFIKDVMHTIYIPDLDDNIETLCMVCDHDNIKAQELSNYMGFTGEVKYYGTISL